MRYKNCRARLSDLLINPKISGGITTLRDGFIPRRARFIKTEFARRILSFVAQDPKFFQKNRDNLLSSSLPLSALSTLSPPSPQPSSPPAKGLRRHHSRSPEVALPSPSKIPPEKASFGRFCAARFLSPRAANSDA
ncbi:unnamed protein product [Prunus brigantina]